MKDLISMAFDARSRRMEKPPIPLTRAAAIGEERQWRGDYNLFVSGLLPGDRDKAPLEEAEREWAQYMLEDRPHHSFGPRFVDFGSGVEKVIPERYLVRTANLKTSSKQAA